MASIANFYFLVSEPGNVVKILSASRAEDIATLPTVMLPLHDPERASALLTA